MKRLTKMILSLLTASSLIACGGGNAPASSGSAGTASGASAATTEAAAPAASAETSAAAPAGNANESVVGMSGGLTTGDQVTSGLEGITSSKDTLAIRMDSDPGTLDGLTTAIMNGTQILSIIDTTLMRTSYDQDLGMVYEVNTKYTIATDYEIADDNSKITWTIRDNAKWSDGKPVTVDDILYSIKRYEANSRYAFIDYANLKKIDETHFEVPLLTADANALTMIGSMALVQQETHEKIGNDAYFTTPQFVSNGAYKITDWVAGDSMKLEAVDDYFGGTPKIKNILIRFIPEASVAMMELETGGIDLIDIPNWTDVSNVINGQYEGVAKHLQLPDMLHTMVGYNLSSDSPCGDLKVRQAIAYAIDREVIALGAYEGVGQVAMTFFSNNVENIKVFSDEEWPYHKDLDKAKELLKEAGYENGFEMTILTNQDANRSMAAQIVKSQLAEIGITANIVNYDNATYAATMSGETDSWDIWLRNWTTAGVCWNQYFTNIVEVNCHPNKDDATWQGYLDKAAKMAAEMDTAKRYAIEDDIQATIMEDALYTYNLIAPIKHVILADGLKNVERCSYNWNMLDAYFE
ncbi:MAG: ABC transporter substrate-binding protein [Solobacterium sp.]|nr:ABC transporter substrate-binding protein [Solobacterium sp.]